MTGLWDGRRAWAKIMARLQDRVRYNRQWRQLAMGENVEADCGTAAHWRDVPQGPTATELHSRATEGEEQPSVGERWADNMFGEPGMPPWDFFLTREDLQTTRETGG